jgi:hypothetical protein
VQPENPWEWEAISKLLGEIAWAGMPVDLIDLADIGSLPAYKLYIFPNCFAPTATERERIAMRLDNSRATALWLGPAGVYEDGSLSPDSSGSMTSIPTKLVSVDANWQGRVADNATDWGLTAGAIYGTSRSGLLAIASDDSAKTLATLQDSELPVLSVKTRIDGGLSVHSALPNLPPGFIQALVKRSDVHLYSDRDDVVWANGELIAIASREAGERTISLPEGGTVTDLWTGEVIANDADRFTATIDEHGTALYRVALTR